jgi:serine/threonine-protein kinase
VYPVIDRVAIPGYRVVRPLATGGMGAVYEVEKLATRKRFAAKFLHEHLATEREYRLRFEREVGALCSVRHPHIVNIFGWRLPGVGEGGKPYILMELLHGEGVDQLLAREIALPPRRALSILLQVLDGLAAAHGAGVIHRDLGPSNVFLVSQPQSDPLVKLLDFGLAGPVGGGEARINVTQAGTVMGKPAYVAPEMFESKQIDARADIFACGVLFFRMIAGRLPYREQESSLLWIERYSERQAPHEYPALHEVLASVPECLDEVCSRAMLRDRDARFRSAREMQLALLDVDTELARLSGETSEASVSWSDSMQPDNALQPDRPLAGAVPGAQSTVAFPVAPSDDFPLTSLGGDTPLPRAVPEDRPLPRLSQHAGPDGKGPIIIEPRKPARRDEKVVVHTAWEVVPRAKPPSTPSASAPPSRTERSASSVIARTVPAGGRSIVLRPAVLAAGIVLLALTVALAVIVSKPTDPGGSSRPAPVPAVAPAPEDPVAPAPGMPPAVPPPAPDAAVATPPSPPPPLPPPPPVQDAGSSSPPGPGVPPPVADAAATGTVHVQLVGLPTGAAASLGGMPLAGEPLQIDIPRSTAPQVLRVAAPGYQVYESQITPSGDLSVSVPLVRVGPTEQPATPGDRGGTTGGHRGGTESSGQHDLQPWPAQLPAPRDAGRTGTPGLPLPETPPW